VYGAVLRRFVATPYCDSRKETSQSSLGIDAETSSIDRGFGPVCAPLDANPAEWRLYNFNVLFFQYRRMLLLLPTPEIRFSMGTKPKAARYVSQAIDDEKFGLWLDTALISRLHRQPSNSPQPKLLPDAERMLHFADLAFGTVKRDKFKSEKVSKVRDE
jgi:hypothetical protein